MDTPEALAVLGISPGASAEDVCSAYLRLVRDHHPDVSRDEADATYRTARLTQAYAHVRAVVAENGGRTVPVEPTEPPAPAQPDRRGVWPFDPRAEPVDAGLVDSDTIAIGAPADEAFVLLFEAAGRVGHVAYFDRQLGILETMVRFEGGPTCSVLMTLQGRALATEVFCTMESIEAAPTPPIRPVVEAIVAELTHPSPEA